MSYPSIGNPYFENDFSVWSMTAAGGFSTLHSEIVSNEKEPVWVDDPFFGGVVLKQGSALWFNHNHMPNSILSSTIAKFKLCLNRHSRIKIGLLKHEIFERSDDVLLCSTVLSRTEDEWFFSEHELPLGVFGGKIIEIGTCVNAGEFVLTVNGDERLATKFLLNSSQRYTFTVHVEEGLALVDYAGMYPVSGGNPIFSGTNVSGSRPNFRTLIYPKDFVNNKILTVMEPQTSKYSSLISAMAKGDTVSFPFSIGDRYSVLGQEPGIFQSAEFDVLTTKELKIGERFEYECSVSHVPGDWGVEINKKTLIRGSEIYNKSLVNTSVSYFNLRLLTLPESWNNVPHVAISNNIIFSLPENDK